MSVGRELCFYPDCVARGDGSTARPGLLAAGLAALAVLVVVAKNGIGVFPSWPFLLNLAENWQDPAAAPLLVPPADYLKANFVAAWLAGALGFVSPKGYVVFNVILTLFALLLPFAMPVVRRRVRTATLLFVAIVGGPIAVVLLTWVGGYDAISVIGLTIAALARHPIVGAVGWLLVGLNHPSLALLGFAVWVPIVVLTAERLVALRRVGFGLAGVLVGAIASTLIVNGWSGATNRWEWFITNEEAPGLGELVGVFFPALFGTVGVLWFVFLRPSFLRTWVVRVLVIEVVVLTVVLPFFVLDITRAIALVMLAAVFTWIGAAEGVHGSQAIRNVDRQLFLPAVIVPIPLVWEGAVVFGDPASTLTVFDGLQLPEWYPQ